MRHFARKSIKIGKCAALNQDYESIFPDEVFISISAELDIKANVCEILDNFFEFTIKHRQKN